MEFTVVKLVCKFYLEKMDLCLELIATSKRCSGHHFIAARNFIVITK